MMTSNDKLIEILNCAILGVKKHRGKDNDYDKGRFHAFQEIRSKWHDLNEDKALNLPHVVKRSCPVPEEDCINQKYCEEKGFCLRCD